MMITVQTCHCMLAAVVDTMMRQDLLFLRSNKAVYDRVAFSRAVATPELDTERSGAVLSAETWVQRFQSLVGPTCSAAVGTCPRVLT